MFTFRFDFLADRRRDPPRERTEAESSSSGENHETEAESSSQGKKKTTEKGSHRGREERSGILEISPQTRRSRRKRESRNAEPPRERKREAEPSTLTENDADSSKIQSTNAESPKERKRRVVEGERKPSRRRRKKKTHTMTCVP
ncbi:hypothetical protein F2Q69_00051044 [Brassica cretica]|uniref:Uncharacterized protein n=1 Tax=Brassica cretica TaxID=69181 RepID=A0A8S9Q4M8_BRACR|nr:hypothetical protein F2Q69_00051044 [Brassica cretica]